MMNMGLDMGLGTGEAVDMGKGLRRPQTQA